MFVEQYYNTIQKILAKDFTEQLDKINEAGILVADTIASDGLVHVFGCGHSHMVAEELFYRAGGLMAINPIFEESTMLHAGAVKSSKIERMSGYAKLVLERYTVKKGDTFIVSSSSGINSFPIEFAEHAKSLGAKVVGITSSSYRCDKSRERRGYHLQDVCDLYIDNNVPHGDAVVEMGSEGIKAGPASSISSFFIADSIVLAACEELERRKIKPPIYMSGNVEGGDTYNSLFMQKYKEKIMHL